MKQLPLCLKLFPSEKHSKSVLEQSIESQYKYKNYEIISGDKNKNLNYKQLKKEIEDKCALNSLVMFVSSPLAEGALQSINEAMQTHKAYVLYSRTSQQYEIVAFYHRIYQMLESNDFGKENAKYIQDNNREALGLGMLELCADFALQIDRQKVLSEDSGNSNRMYFAVGTTSSVFKDRKVYEPIMRLSQDLQFSKRELGDMKKGLAEARKAAEPKMMRAIERQELLFLPANHSIEMLEYQKFSELYGIDQNIEDASKQVRLCVTINSYNNVGNNRNIKLLKSVLRQNYKNYHIVFNDDHSTDGTMQQTIDFLKKANFPQERVTYVQNLRNNFAYYNCLNAAYNFCGEDDVQLILDGDDEVLGSYAFHVMNVGYQKDKTNDLWVYYSTHKTNYYQLGRSRGIGYYREYEYSMDTPNGKVRKLVSAIGQITTWRVKVLFGITKENTRMANGEWIDAGYDDSITQPLAELCTVDRFKYIHELLYEYNRYSNNEDSTPAGADHRRTIYKHLLGLKMLKPLTTLNGQKRNPELEKEFIQQNGVRYKVLKP